MIRASLIEIIRDNKGKIIGYKIEDSQGKVLEANPKKLKEAIRENKLSCEGLKLTSDSRLIRTNTVNKKEPDYESKKDRFKHQ